MVDQGDRGLLILRERILMAYGEMFEATDKLYQLPHPIPVPDVVLGIKNGMRKLLRLLDEYAEAAKQ